MTTPVAASGLWTRGQGIRLVRADFAALTADEEIRRALLDGIDRRLEDEPLPELPAEAISYAIRVGGQTVGVLSALEGERAAGDVRVLALAVAPSQRGHAYAARALLTAERRWLRDGAARVLVRVPATNGRGLYYLLRCGFTPLPEQPEPGATWFARREVARV